MKCCSLEPDWIYFHPDMSGRIIHVGPNLIKYEPFFLKSYFLLEETWHNCINSVVWQFVGQNAYKALETIKFFDLSESEVLVEKSAYFYGLNVAGNTRFWYEICWRTTVLGFHWKIEITKIIYFNCSFLWCFSIRV